MFISPAYAQAAGGGGGGMEAFIPFAAIGLIFYFLLLRPQQKQRKVHREMLENLRRGDQVVTGGGIIGKITKVISETEVTVEIAEDVKVTVARSTIQGVLTPQDGAANKNTASGKSDDKTADKGQAARPKGLLGSLLGGRK